MPRILVIEDDDVTAREIAAELTGHGIDVDRIADGSEGLLRAADPCYDAITLDMMLPGMDGLSVVTRLRAQGVTTPVLMLSAMGEVNERVTGTIGLKLYKGHARVITRSSPNAVYDAALASFSQSGGLFSQSASPGFIEIFSLQSRMAWRLRND